MTPLFAVLTLALLTLSGHVVDHFNPPAPQASFPDSDAC